MADRPLPSPDQRLADIKVAPGKLQAVTGFGGNPGNLGMLEYTPAGPPPGKRPLVVVLHGCGEAAAGHARRSGWQTLADRRGLYLALAEQRLINNVGGCFNWYSLLDQARGEGEALSIKQMVDWMLTRRPVDPKRVFVAGLSAGGGMSAVMMAAYPELFAGGAIMAGVPYGCASSLVGGQLCMAGVGKTAQQWGALARAGAPAHPGPWPVAAVFHGASDKVVSPTNLQELAEQWTAVRGADSLPDKTDLVAGHARKTYQDATGRAVVETYLLAGMGHGVAVDPGTSASQGGEAGTFYFDVNLWAALRAAMLWGI